MPREEKNAIIPDLIEWFKNTKRQFPWRSPKCTPYAIWVSEVMLQQTRAEVVVPYFLRWMEQFPTIGSLASADEDVVIKTWEGLGYYGRARRLWQGARFLKENHAESLPSSYEELLEIPGFGPYTAGAVASFAFHQKEAAVDGNVARVMSRLFAIEEDVEKNNTQRLIRELVLGALPDEEPWVAMEALIELGALVCKKTPYCHLCPFERVCEAKRLNIVQRLPSKKQKPLSKFLERDVILLHYEGQVLVRRVQQGQVMAGLYEFPYFERKSQSLEDLLRERFSVDAICQAVLDPVNQSFTRFRVRLYPSFWECGEKQAVEGFIWVPLEGLGMLPFSSGHRKILPFLRGAL